MQACTPQARTCRRLLICSAVPLPVQLPRCSECFYHQAEDEDEYEDEEQPLGVHTQGVKHTVLHHMRHRHGGEAVGISGEVLCLSPRGTAQLRRGADRYPRGPLKHPLCVPSSPPGGWAVLVPIGTRIDMHKHTTRRCACLGFIYS